MSIERDIIIEKLDKDLAKARLALAKIYTVIDRIPFWSTEIKEINETLWQYFKDNKDERKE